ARVNSARTSRAPAGIQPEVVSDRHEGVYAGARVGVADRGRRSRPAASFRARIAPRAPPRRSSRSTISTCRSPTRISSERGTITPASRARSSATFSQAITFQVSETALGNLAIATRPAARCAAARQSVERALAPAQPPPVPRRSTINSIENLARGCADMPDFTCTDLLPAGPDTTEYPLLTSDGISTGR